MDHPSEGLLKVLELIVDIFRQKGFLKRVNKEANLHNGRLDIAFLIIRNSFDT